MLPLYIISDTHLGVFHFSHVAKLTLFAGLLLCADLHAQDSESAATELKEVRVISNTPLGSTGIPLSKFAGNVQTIKQKDIPVGAQGFADVLNQNLGSVNINDTQGNPHNVDLLYRGFTASPILGSAQGISVFLDGMRVNEPFGDIMSWDLIPQIAVDNAILVPGSNPVYGLNTLGGAVALHTKNGFSFSGTEAKLGFGSFGRKSLDAEKGGHTDTTSYYLAASLNDDNGWAAHNPSSVRQFFAKVGTQDDRRDIHLTFAWTDNSLYGNQSVPVSKLANAKQGYTHLDYTNTQNANLNLNGIFDLGNYQSISGNIYYRWIKRSVLNSNLNGSTNAGTVCADYIDCVASNLLANYSQNIAGANAQWTQASPVWSRSNMLTAGYNAEVGRTSFTNNGQDAYVDGSFGLIAVDAFAPQASVASKNRRYGLFVTDTLDVSNRLAVTASARYDAAAIQLDGITCTDSNTTNTLCGTGTTQASIISVVGNHTYRRLNPALGATYQLASNTTSFATYSEGFRTPSAIELACADPNQPCSGIPNAFGADPELKAVISRTAELGFRGKWSEAANWRMALFRSELTNDIVFNSTNATQGYFSNVGHTRRQGLEMGFSGKAGRWNYALNLSWIDATFQSPFAIANEANSTCVTVGPTTTCPFNRKGDKMPGNPDSVLKLRLGYALTPETLLGATLQAQGSMYARGDENNLDATGKVPGFNTLKLDTSHRLNKSLELFGSISNVFDKRYATYGVVAHNNLAAGTPEQFRSLGAPRALFAGVRGNF